MTVSIARADLVVLVQMLRYEHFGYDAKGRAAHRAFESLEAAADTDVPSLEILPPVPSPTGEKSFYLTVDEGFGQRPATADEVNLFRHAIDAVTDGRASFAVDSGATR